MWGEYRGVRDMTVTIADDKRSFLAEGRPFFYLADTVWSAFTNPTMEEWGEYLAYRKTQGFNTLQISILPILHDASQSDLGLLPFAVDAQGRWDFHSPVPAYFERAAEMIAAARDEGFMPALVVLWCGYVPNSWANQGHPATTIPYDALPGYVECVVRAFARFDPIFLISGDTNFETAEVTNYYRTALRIVKERCPHSLTTLHLTPAADLPEELAQSPDLDFYMFQSGHQLEEQRRAYTLAERFAALPVQRPIINGEPPYEGHGYGHRQGRFSAFEVRRAVWQSLLSGASAGVTYGAHGIWSWHRRGAAFTSEAFSGRPFDWRTALRFEGAWDVAFARALFEQYALFGLSSRQDLLDIGPEIRLAASPDLDRVALYVPYATEVKVKIDPTNYEWTVIDLATRRRHHGQVPEHAGHAVVEMHQDNSDILVIGVRAR
jgi:hypothetical protein